MNLQPLDKASARTFARIMGVVAFVTAAVVLWEPPHRPTGRWSWLLGQAFDVAGSAGVAAALAAIGVLLVAVSFRRD